MKAYLDHDRSPLGIIMLEQPTFFGREVVLPDRLYKKMADLLDRGLSVRSLLRKVYEQPDHRIRAAVLESMMEELITLCDAAEQEEQPKKQDIGAPLSSPSPKKRGRPASNSATSQPTEK